MLWKKKKLTDQAFTPKPKRLKIRIRRITKNYIVVKVGS